MKQTAYIGTTENGLYLEIEGIGKNGETYRKRTNKKETIEGYIIKNAIQFVDATIKGDNLKLYTTNKTVIVVKDYAQLQNEPMLKSLFRRLNRAPIVSDNLKQNKRTNLIQAMQLNLLYANKKKLAALALTGSLLVVGMPLLTANISNFKISPVETANTIMEEVIEKDDARYHKEAVAPIVDMTDMTNSLELEERLMETKELQTYYHGYDNSKIMLGARVNIDKMANLFEKEEAKIIRETAHTYGVDPYLLLAKGLAESSLDHEACIPNGSRYNGYGVGAFQLESPDGRIVKAWNYETGSEDALAITMENAIDFQLNTQAAAMYLQNRLNLYNGNIYLALQSYNYGEAMMKVIIHDYAKQIGVTDEDVKNNIQDLGWLSIVEDVHQNPNNYYYRVTIDLEETNPEVIAEAQAKYVWKHGTYGNPHYIADVLSFYVGLLSENKNLNGTNTVINFSNNEVKQATEENTVPKLF